MGSSDIDKWIGDARDSTVSFFNDHVEQPVYSFFPLTFPLALLQKYEKFSSKLFADPNTVRRGFWEVC